MPSYVYDLAMFLPHRTIIADTHEGINGYAINSRERMRNRRETSTRIQRTTTVENNKATLTEAYFYRGDICRLA